MKFYSKKIESNKKSNGDLTHQTHWSRKPEQIAHDTEILRKAGIVFHKDQTEFDRIRPAELKDKLMDFLMEAGFAGANDPEHRRAQNLK